MDKELRDMLQKRKQEMLELDKAGFQFEEYESYLPEAETDPELALYYLTRDLILEFKQLRREKGLTQADVAAKMGTKQAAVSRFENYGNTPSLEFAFKYAWALGVKLNVSVRTEATQENVHEVRKSDETHACWSQFPISPEDNYIVRNIGDMDFPKSGLVFQSIDLNPGLHQGFQYKPMNVKGTSNGKYTCQTLR